jgi:tetratricopeptide (TPR) repeat protein
MGKWSKRDVNRLRTVMTEQGRGLDEIAEEIRHLTGCSRLAAVRMALGWSQPEAVERYAAQTSGSVMDQPLLSRLEAFPTAGSRAPQATQIITLAAIYGTAPLRLLDPHALDRMEEHERAVLIRCNSAFTTVHAATVPAADSALALGPPTTASPSTQQVTGPASTSPTLTTTMPRPPLTPATGHLERQVEMAARRALRFAVTAEGSNVGPETLDQLRDEVARLALAYPQQPLPVLLADLVDLQDVAFRLLEGRQRPSETTDLYLLAGALCGMLAKASHDLGDPHSAMTQARTAYVCADNADHHGLRAWTRGLQSMIAYWAGWPNEAVRYAELGTGPAASAAGTSSVWLPAQEARAWAVLGDAEKAEAAIAQADHARDGVRGDELDDLGGIMTFSRPRQLYYAADARVWLPGAEEQAAETAAEAITAYEAADHSERSFSDEAGARSDQALARVNSGDLEGAAQSLRPVLDLAPEQRIGGVVTSVMRVHEALRNPDYRSVPLARDTQQEIETYSQVGAVAALPRGR